MNNKLKICIVTGTRAEYGLLQPVMQAIKDDISLELQVVVTGMHLSPEFGLTYKVIEKDGFEITEKVEILLSSDSSVGIAKAIGLCTISFAEVLDRLNPDFMMLLGDRFELLAAAQAALVSRIPIAHLSGGDVTEGAFDEAIRHSITKMSHLHFVTNKDSVKRVQQLGENPDHIYLVGNPGLDHLRKLKLMSKGTLERSLGFKFREKNILVTYHPVTLDDIPSQDSFIELLNALSSFDNSVGIIFTKPNADTDGRALIKLLESYSKERSNWKVYTSLGQLRYLSASSIVDVVVGNSSSGILEVPSLKTPTVNIGDRQKGRIQAESVINCQPKSTEIISAIIKSFSMDCSNIYNPYGDGKTAQRVVDCLKTFQSPKVLIKKHFFDVNFEL